MGAGPQPRAAGGCGWRGQRGGVRGERRKRGGGGELWRRGSTCLPRCPCPNGRCTKSVALLHFNLPVTPLCNSQVPTAEAKINGSFSVLLEWGNPVAAARDGQLLAGSNWQQQNGNDHHHNGHGHHNGAHNVPDLGGRCGIIGKTAGGCAATYQGLLRLSATVLPTPVKLPQFERSLQLPAVGVAGSRHEWSIEDERNARRAAEAERDSLRGERDSLAHQLVHAQVRGWAGVCRCAAPLPAAVRGGGGRNGRGHLAGLGWQPGAPACGRAGWCACVCVRACGACCWRRRRASAAWPGVGSSARQPTSVPYTPISPSGRTPLPRRWQRRPSSRRRHSVRSTTSTCCARWGSCCAPCTPTEHRRAAHNPEEAEGRSAACSCLQLASHPLRPTMPRLAAVRHLTSPTHEHLPAAWPVECTVCLPYPSAQPNPSPSLPPACRHHPTSLERPVPPPTFPGPFLSVVYAPLLCAPFISNLIPAFHSAPLFPQCRSDQAHARTHHYLPAAALSVLYPPSLPLLACCKLLSGGVLTREEQRHKGRHGCGSMRVQGRQGCVQRRKQERGYNSRSRERAAGGGGRGVS